MASVVQLDKSVVKLETDLVLVGKTGTGKSSLGNSLLGKTSSGKPFKTGSAGGSVTVECKRTRANLQDGTLLTIVDTPGLFDTKIPNEETSQEIVKCIALCAPGPHVIVFVLSMRRITQEEIKTIEILKKLFGKESIKHVIVVFTGKDELGDDDDITTVQDWVESSPEYLREFLKECDSRYVGIANKPNSPTHKSDVEDVMNLIYKTKEENGNQVYTREAFNKADQLMKEEIERNRNRSSKSERELLEEIKEKLEANDPGLLRTLGRGLSNKISDAFSYFGI